eukprot:TRINITY_DN28762_c0_g1_i1.p2 TRINITY_DN28762_c0_g1~~TRINITY_DN28762_c0_g1_i1.p2  ORF type:complete len:107 (+),score=14.93 TRINITY_DN28762_c0_g1_i1:63-383(+)
MFFFFLMTRRPPRSTHCISSAASDVYKRQHYYLSFLNAFTLLVQFVPLAIMVSAVLKYPQLWGLYLVLCRHSFATDYQLKKLTDAKVIISRIVFYNHSGDGSNWKY